MNAKNILVPTDFSSRNDAALEFASRLASEEGAILHILHVDEMCDFDIPLAVAGAEEAKLNTWDRSKVHDRIGRIKPVVDGVRYMHHYRAGTPATEIVNCANGEYIDLIVMSSHGRAGLARLLMGSTAEEVMRKASCPVMIVKYALGQRDVDRADKAVDRSPTRLGPVFDSEQHSSKVVAGFSK